jgi:hypothetical protein
MLKEIIEIDHGIGHTIDGVIYINKNLEDHPQLYFKVLLHEVKHAMGHKDVDKKEKFSLALWKWIICNPRSWSHFVPIWYCGPKEIAISTRYTIIWSFIIMWLIIMVKVFKWINTL